MDNEDFKKYNILENVFQKINQKYVALPADETKRNNRMLQVIDQIIQKLRNNSVLFNNLYENKFYGGSFYDGLKVGKPSEFDLDCLLCLPKIVEPTVEVSNKPGYVHIILKNMKALEKSVIEHEKYVGLEKLLDGDRLSTKKVKSWMESLMTSAVNGNSKVSVTIDDNKECIVKYKMVKSGPALTIKLDGECDGKNFSIDIDLVPCFKFFDDQWPKKGYKKIPEKSKKNTFFVVPKSPRDDLPLHWRLSFQEQERELFSGYAVMKPVIRLIKKIRDRHNHKIASYFIKTIFLWELETVEESMWSKSISFVLVMMLKKYAEYLERRTIPYYWNKDNNLIGDLTEITVFCIANKIKNIINEIEKICETKSDIYTILPHFLSNDEYNLDEFKKEIPLSKKLLKQAGVVKVPESPVPFVYISESSNSSRASSFEEITLAMVNEASDTNKNSAKLDQVLAGQKRMFAMLEIVMKKIDNCDTQIKELKCEFDKKKIFDDLQQKELTEKLSDIDKRLQGVKKSDSPPSVEDLLGLTNNLGSLNFQSL